MFKIVSYFTGHRYYIGFFAEKYLRTDTQSRYEQVRWLELRDYNSGWFADPFFLDVNGEKVKLLAEEFLWSRNRGRISLLDIERRGDRFVLSRVKPVLELDTHLSFPYVFQTEDSIYVLPESIKSGKTSLYKFDPIGEQLTNGRALIEEPLADPCLFEMEGTYFLMGTDASGAAMEMNTHLNVYSSPSLWGPYSLKQTIINKISEERGAGCVFYSGESRLIRPTQYCENRYGEYVIFNELKYQDSLFSEEVVYKLEPDYKKPRSYSLHTFNLKGNLCVIDGLTYRFPKLGPYIIRILDKLFGR